jgi:hypothetical protein
MLDKRLKRMEDRVIKTIPKEETRDMLQAGFSPEQRIFLRRHAMHASGRRFRSFPALVFISLQG